MPPLSPSTLLLPRPCAIQPSRRGFVPSLELANVFHSPFYSTTISSTPSSVTRSSLIFFFSFQRDAVATNVTSTVSYRPWPRYSAYDAGCRYLRRPFRGTRKYHIWTDKKFIAPSWSICDGKLLIFVLRLMLEQFIHCGKYNPWLSVKLL